MFVFFYILVVLGFGLVILTVLACTSRWIFVDFCILEVGVLWFIVHILLVQLRCMWLSFFAFSSVVFVICLF